MKRNTMATFNIIMMIFSVVLAGTTIIEAFTYADVCMLCLLPVDVLCFVLNWAMYRINKGHNSMVG